MSDLEKSGILLALKKGLRLGLSGKRSKWLHNHIEQLEARNKELLATIEKLRSELGIDMFKANDINVPNTIETMQDAIDESPQQSLAAHNAKVARKVILLLANKCNRFFNEDGEGFMTKGEMIEYAQCVKDGE